MPAGRVCGLLPRAAAAEVHTEIWSRSLVGLGLRNGQGRDCSCIELELLFLYIYLRDTQTISIWFLWFVAVEALVFAIPMLLS